MNKVNYHIQLETQLKKWAEEGRTPRLLLHSCCAPCSSACLEFLTHYIPVTVFYFNPNITAKDEYEFRLSEQKRLIREMPFEHPVDIIEGRYDPQEFFDMARGLEQEPERGARCHLCYRARMAETMKTAQAEGYDYFATTLTLSPLKPSEVINRIGLELCGSSPEEYAGCCGPAAGNKGMKVIREPERTGQPLYLPSDFKKNDGYKRSIELSAQYGLYRQNYCGCIYSRRDRQEGPAVDGRTD